MDYILKKSNVEVFNQLKERFKLSHVMSAVLSNRADSIDDVKYFFENNLQILHSPFYFSAMEECIDRIKKAIVSREKVYIFGDRDTDGLTSVTLMYDFLTKKGLSVLCFVPSGDDFYGFDRTNFDKAKKENATLVITVDTGITMSNEIDYGKSLGIDVIVLDHHEPKECLPNCIVINPKCKILGYPFSSLSAAGVVSKVIWAIEFSQLDEYNKRRVLFVSKKCIDGSVEIIADFVKNFVVEKRIEKKYKSIDEFFKSEEFAQINNRLVCVYKRDEISSLFGEIDDLYLKLLTFVPNIRNKSLGDLKKEKKFFKDECEILEFLYKSYVLRKNANISQNYLQILDLVAISTIADMMSLRDENRILTRLGLATLNKRERINIAGLLAQPNLIGSVISSKDVGFSIAPVINSAGRLGKTEIALNMLLEEKLDMIDIYTRELMSLNAERQDLKLKAYYNLRERAEKCRNR